jgi:hemoglobin-like flavoprotein
MPNHTDKFSNTEIKILENGLRWIKESQDKFAKKFYNRLLREHPEVNPFLQSIGPWSFNKDFVPSLDAIIGEIRSHGSVISPLKHFWPELSSIAMAPLEPSELIKIAETFLDLVSELAEDAWSPTLKNAWRKAIKTVMSGSWEPVEHSFFLSDSQTFLSTKGKVMTTTQDMMFCFGTMLLMAGGIAALGLWRRGHIVEGRLKEKEPLRLSVCS